jgi:crotonobetainyl-CoA:carnitine CoA-transferase CaiB-like acyl-CoA transferase
MNGSEEESMRAGEKPLSDIAVLDLSRVLAGFYATMVLGDLSATRPSGRSTPA